MKPICVPCRRFFRVKKNGQWFTEPAPGNADPHAWVPYKVWVGDKWECPDCGTEIVVGVGSGPVAEHYQEDFEQVRERYTAGELNINDC